MGLQGILVLDVLERNIELTPKKVGLPRRCLLPPEEGDFQKAKIQVAPFLTPGTII
jgi:hypothetical protein